MSARASEKPTRVIVDPAVQEAEDLHERIMQRFRAMTREQHIRWNIEHGFMHADGSWKLPEGDPCVSRVE